VVEGEIGMERSREKLTREGRGFVGGSMGGELGGVMEDIGLDGRAWKENSKDGKKKKKKKNGIWFCCRIP
jgi:hypothetical protein